MKYFLSCFLFIASFQVAGEVSTGDVSQMLDQMVKEGTISAEEAAKAKLKMQNMDQQEWSTLNGQAEKVAANRSPASVSAISEAKGGDLDSAQFKQIQDDIKKIMPEYHE